LSDSFITPTELFYVRNHLPVPKLEEKTFRLEIDGLGDRSSVELTLDDLKTKIPKSTVISTIQVFGFSLKKIVYSLKCKRI
jgi:sulfite oxidase